MRKWLSLHIGGSKSTPSSRAPSPSSHSRINPKFSISSRNLSSADHAEGSSNQETLTSERVSISVQHEQSSGHEIEVSGDALPDRLVYPYRSPSHVGRRPPSESPPSSTPPWSAWEVERDSLCCINQWNQDHQDNKFATVVLRSVNRLLESQVFEATLAFIPDNPVPAKSLIKALVSLTLLVTKIPEAKQEVCDFAKEVATDINLLADAFGSSDSPLLNRAWDDLQETRDCVNDICKWANDQLPKFLGDASGLHLKVGDWKAKLDGAKSRFSQRTLIHILRAVGTASQHLDELYHDRLIEKCMKSIQTTLGNHVVPTAKYDAEGQKRREYHDQTRKDILNTIAKWTDQKSGTARCMWVTGKPGVGKSTIGAQVAQNFEDERSLYAQFFVTRDIAHTTNPDNIFPTMAQQLAEKSPLAAVVLHEKLQKVPPSQVKKLSREQALAIFVEPLRTIAHYADKIVVIVDGVDEIDNTASSTLSKVTSVLCSIMRDLPSKVRILVLSRPETPIIKNIPSIIDRLDLALENSQSDVEKMVHTDLHQLAETYNWDYWPSPTQEEEFFQQIRWSYQKEVMRDTAFADVLALPSTDLEHLYGLIFRRVTPPEHSKLNHTQFLKGFQIVIGCLAAIQEPLKVSTVSDLVSSDLKSSGLDPFDIVDFLNSMSSIFVDGRELMSGETVPKAHKSVFDYLTSNRPDPSLRLFLPDQDSHMTKTCFRILCEELHFNIGRIQTSHKTNKELSGSEMQSISPHIVYACNYVGRHLEKIGPDAFLSDIAQFMENDFLQWLEVLSLTGKVDSAKSTLQIMKTHIGCKNPPLSCLIRDGATFVTKFKIPISASAPHYISALPQAPFRSLIRLYYLPNSSHFLRVKGDENMKDEEPASVRAASLFHDGTHLAATFSNDTLRIIALTRGVDICTPIVAHAYAVAVSPDGKLVATVGREALCLRNAKTGEEIGRLDIVGAGPLVFSPDGACIAVGCQSNICVFNVDAGEVPSSPFEGHEKAVLSVAYFPDGTQIVSGSKDHSVRVWNASNGSLILKFDGHTWWDTVSFSPNGAHIAAGASDGTIRLWTVETRRSRQLTENSRLVRSLAFSPDGQSLVAVSDNVTRLWDLSTTPGPSSSKLVGYHATREASSVAFFPDGKRIMSASADGTIRVWDGDELEVCRDSWDGDGVWIFGEKEERLFWTLSGVRHPRNTFIVGRHVDLEHFVHGEEWIKCREPYPRKLIVIGDCSLMED